MLEGVVVVALQRRYALEDLSLQCLAEQVLDVIFESLHLPLERAAQLGRHIAQDVRTCFGGFFEHGPCGIRD